jgi:hypothetical protein
MTEELENELRRLMRPVAAPDDLTKRIMAALPQRAAPATVTSIARAPKRARSYWMPGALAASLIGAVILGQFVAKERDAELARVEAVQQAEGLAASRDVMEALRLTSQKLDLAYQAVNDPPPAEDVENRT